MLSVAFKEAFALKQLAISGTSDVVVCSTTFELSRRKATSNLPPRIFYILRSSNEPGAFLFVVLIMLQEALYTLV